MCSNVVVSSSTEVQRQLLSVVVPCFNEELVIVEAYRRLTDVLEQSADFDFEIIFVDDGSQDQTMELLRNIHESDPRVGIVKLSRNFGHQIAVTAGLEAAKGDAVIIIDADLQDPPEVISAMWARREQGADVAYGVRTVRVGESAFKLWTAKKFYQIINHLSDTPIPMDTGDFRLMDRKVVDALLRMSEQDRFIRGMVAWLGFRQEPVFYERAARFAGQTKYPLRKMIYFAADGVFSFSRRPLQLAVHLGFSASAIALIGILYAIILRLFSDSWVTGWTLLFIAILFIGGVQLICLGIIGEYLGRVYGEVKRRPLYVVSEHLERRDSVQKPSSAVSFP